MRGVSAPPVFGWLATGAAITDPRMVELSRSLHHSTRQNPPPEMTPRARLDHFQLPAFAKANRQPEHGTPAERRLWYLVHSGKVEELAREFPELKKRRIKV